MTTVVYSTERVDMSEGQVFQNARLFDKPLPGATRVIIHGDWPKVRDAYFAAGVEVVRAGEEDHPKPAPAVIEQDPEAAALAPLVPLTGAAMPSAADRAQVPDSLAIDHEEDE